MIQLSHLACHWLPCMSCIWTIQTHSMTLAIYLAHLMLHTLVRCLQVLLLKGT